MKLIYPTMLAYFAYAEEDHLTNLEVTCPSANVMSVTFDYDKVITLESLDIAGNCNDADATITADGQSYTVEFNPYTCSGSDGRDENDVNTYSVNVDVGFTAALDAQGVSLLLRDHEFNAACGYQSTYTASYTFGDIDLNENDEGDISGDSLTFGFTEYTDEHYNDTNVPATASAGDHVYLILEGDDALDSSTFNFAPVSCTIAEEGTSNSFLLFDYSVSSNCENAHLPLDVSQESDGSWKISYMLFLFNHQQTSNYILTCDIELCLASSGSSTCANVATACA